MQADIWTLLEQARGSLDSQGIHRALLIETTHQLGEAEALAGIDTRVWTQVADTPAHPMLQAAARALRGQGAADRLRTIDALMERSGREAAEAWMNPEAARQIAAFAGTARSVRCAFQASLRAALAIALNTKEQGAPCAVRYIQAEKSAAEMARLIANALEIEIDVVIADPLSRTDGDSFAFEVSTPPLGMPIRSRDAISHRTLHRFGADSPSGRLLAETAAIADLLVHARGPAVLSTTSGALFRTVGLESIAREDLIASRRLQGVFSVAPGTMYPGTGIATALLAFTEPDRKVDLIRLVDLSHERFATAVSRGRQEIRPEVSWFEALGSEIAPGDTWGIDVGLIELRAQDNILTVERYLNTGVAKALQRFLATQDDTRPLGDLCEIIRPLSVRSSEDGEIRILEASLGDIGENGYIEKPAKRLSPDRSALRIARNQEIRPGDLVLSIRGTIGNVGLVPDETGHGSSEEFWTAGQSLAILRPRSDRLSSIALYEYLSSAIVRDYLQSLAGGTGLITLNLRDLQRLDVPVPSREEQAGIEAAFHDRQKLFEQIATLRAGAIRARAESWPHRELR